MTREIRFTGDELELLMAMDGAGCVLTDDGAFYCDADNIKLRYAGRLPARIRGTYTREGEEWVLRCSIVPAPRTTVIGAVCFLVFLCFLITGISLRGAILFGILSLAMAVNFLAQRSECMRRFESRMSRGCIE